MNDLTIKSLVTRFEHPNTKIRLRDDSIIEVKHWFRRERDRWNDKRNGRHLISVIDVDTFQVALAEVEEPITDFDVYRPVNIDRESIDFIDRRGSITIFDYEHQRDPKLELPKV